LIRNIKGGPLWGRLFVWKVKAMPELTNLRHERFAQEYVTSMLDPSHFGLGVPNATRAAMAAGFSKDNPRGAKVMASRLLCRTDVADRVEELSRQQAQAWQDRREQLIGAVVEKLWSIAFKGYREIELPDGRVASVSEGEQGQLLLNMDFPKEDLGGVTRLRDVVKTSDQLRAYEMLLKVFEAFEADDLPPVTGDIPEKVQVDLL